MSGILERQPDMYLSEIQDHLREAFDLEVTEHNPSAPRIYLKEGTILLHYNHLLLMFAKVSRAGIE